MGCPCSRPQRCARPAASQLAGRAAAACLVCCCQARRLGRAHPGVQCPAFKHEESNLLQPSRVLPARPHRDLRRTGRAVDLRRAPGRGREGARVVRPPALLPSVSRCKRRLRAHPRHRTSAASSNGYPYTPQEMAGKATALRPCWLATWRAIAAPPGRSEAVRQGRAVHRWGRCTQEQPAFAAQGTLRHPAPPAPPTCRLFRYAASSSGAETWGDSYTGPTVWMTWRAASSPPPVMRASPVGHRTPLRTWGTARQASSSAGPAARWMAPSPPPPPSMLRRGGRSGEHKG